MRDLCAEQDLPFCFRFLIEKATERLIYDVRHNLSLGYQAILTGEILLKRIS
jgi:hypothetical protein